MKKSVTLFEKEDFFGEILKKSGKKEAFSLEKLLISLEKTFSAAALEENSTLLQNLKEEIKTCLKEEAYSFESTEKLSLWVKEKLLKKQAYLPLKIYEEYKKYENFQQQSNTLDEEVEMLLLQKNEELMDENSNKNAVIVSTQRDLMAGELSKDLSKRKLLPLDLLLAHETGALHIHDLDYFLQPMFNCCLIHLEDMLENGTVINGKAIESPKSFQVACTVMTQIIAQVASSQYGGQSINGVDKILAPYARKSFMKYKELAKKEQEEIYQMPYREDLAEKIALERLKKEIKDGVQTIQYQINTLMTTNGQSPFVTLFLHFDPHSPYAQESAMICEEILKQRIEGIKNEQGVWVTPAFPKLIYVLDEHNIHKDSTYYYLTKLAAACTAQRMYPDYISAKKMREMYEGNVFSPMGCRSFLSPYKNEKGEYQWDGRFNQGVVSLNLPQIALVSEGDEERFFAILKKRLMLVKKALMLRHQYLKKMTSDVSPIHWQHGALTRLKPGESLAPYLTSAYSTLSLGYIGLYECAKLLCGESHTQAKGKTLALKIMQTLNEAKEKWCEEEKLAFAVYGTPAESLTHRFCQLDKRLFGEIPDITDKGYYTNSYHVDVREDIQLFEKFAFESVFQEQSKGGMISYAEIPSMKHNPSALLQMLAFLYDNIMYAEFNTKLDFCHQCSYAGEIGFDEQGHWQCPQCKNKNRRLLTVIRRTCGYLGENFWNKGRTKEIQARKLHI